MSNTRTNGGFLMSQIRHLSARAYEKILRDSGIDAFNGSQGRILYVLWENGSMTISRIGKLTGLANTTLTSMLDRMEMGGLITRNHDPKNRRQIIISLTQKAENLRTDSEQVSDQVNEVFYRGFTDEEIISFEEYLRRILKNFGGD